MIRFDLNKVIVEKIRDVSHRYLLTLFIVASFSFLSFGQFAVSIAYNNDGIGRFFMPIGWKSLFNIDIYLEGLSKGRWAYPFFVNLYNGATGLPFFVTFISIFLFVITSAVIWKLFDVKLFLQRIIIGALISSSPIFVHYFFYTGDAEVYATGILFISVAAYLFTFKGNFKKIIGVLLSVIALACYPAIFGYSMGLVSLYSINLFFKEEAVKSFFYKSSKIFFLFLISLILYYVVTKFLINLFEIKMTSYKGADSISPIKLIKNFPDQLNLTYLLFAKFWQESHIIIKGYLVVISLLLIVVILIKKIKKLPLLFLLLVTSIPLIFVMHLITFETGAYEGFQFGLIPALALLHIPLIKIEKTWIKNVILILPFLLIFINMKTTNQIIMKYRLNCENSRFLTFNIANDIQKHSTFHVNKRIAIIGNIMENDNYSFSQYINRTVVLNGMQYPVAVTGTNDLKKISNQIKLQGFKFEYVDKKELTDLNNFFIKKDLPEYPKEGSVFNYNNIIIVNLGSRD